MSPPRRPTTPQEDVAEVAEPEMQMFMEWAFRANPSGEGDETRCLLEAFAEDDSVPRDAARRAAQWRQHARYGLWVVRDPRPRPHVWLRDVLTGRSVWAQFAPEQAQNLPAWSALLGYVVPVDGIWRMGGAFVMANPGEGDALAMSAARIVELVIADALESENIPAPPSVVEDLDAPPTVVFEQDPPFQGLESTVSAILSQAIPHLMHELDAMRSEPLKLHNSDGEPVVIINALVDVADSEALRRSLAEHPDFEDQEDHVVWWGRELTSGEGAQMHAELEEEGYEIVDDDGPRRWLCGRLEVD